MAFFKQAFFVAFWRSAYYERQILTHNRWDFSLVFWIPLMTLFGVWWIFSQSQIANLPIGVIDNDRGQVANTLIRYLEASPELKVVGIYPTEQAAKQAILERKIYGVVVIPNDFDKKIFSAQPSPVVLQVNAQYGTHSGIIQKGVQSAVGTVSAGAEIKRLIKQGQTPEQAKISYSPIQISRVSLFNPATDYQLFLASTVLPSLLHILAMIIGATTVGRELRDKKLDVWYDYIAQNTDVVPSFYLTNNANFADAPSSETSETSHHLTPTQSNLAILIAGLNGKLIYPMIAYALWGAVALTLAHQVHASSLSALGLTYVCLILLLMLSFWLGAILTLATFSLRIGLSGTGFISAPSYAFAGVTFPYIAINDSAKYWTNALPLTHYLQLHIAQLQMAAPIAVSLPIVIGFVPAVLIGLILTALLTKRALAHPERWGAR